MWGGEPALGPAPPHPATREGCVPSGHARRPLRGPSGPTGDAARRGTRGGHARRKAGSPRPASGCCHRVGNLSHRAWPRHSLCVRSRRTPQHKHSHVLCACSSRPLCCTHMCSPARLVVRGVCVCFLDVGSIVAHAACTLVGIVPPRSSCQLAPVYHACGVVWCGVIVARARLLARCRGRPLAVPYCTQGTSSAAAPCMLCRTIIMGLHFVRRVALVPTEAASNEQHTPR